MRQNRGERWSLSWLMPMVIVLFATADALLRFVPLDFFAFRAWEAMKENRPRSGPFAAHKKYDNPWAYGDLASMGNMPRLRQYRRETFTTDAFGFRNPPDLERRGLATAIVVGDSFAAGSGVSDDETLSARLMTLSGQMVYNTGGNTIGMGDLRTLAHRLRMKRGLVVYVYLERTALPSQQVAARSLYSGTADPDHQTPLSAARRIWASLTISRLGILVLRAEKAWDETVQQNRVVLRHLRTGEEILFLPDEVSTSLEQRSIDAAPLAWMRDELKKINLDLLVVLVPNKFSVYQPLLRELEVEAQPPYLDRLERALTDSQVSVLNLRTPFMERAAADLATRKMLYWKDDTHWNAAGIELAAQEILAVHPALAPR